MAYAGKGAFPLSSRWNRKGYQYYTNGQFGDRNTDEKTTWSDWFFVAASPPPPVTYYGILKRWTGAAWTKAELLVYSGGSFVAKNTYRYDGSAWKKIDVTGV
jgi:hypothetical protein